MVFTHHMWCEGVGEMHAEGLGEAGKCLCSQMTCGWHELCQAGRQVALGSHSRTWEFRALLYQPSCTHKCRDTHTQRASWVTQTMGGGGCSLHALSWKWHVSLRRGIKWLEKEDCAMCLQRLVHKDWRISQLKSDAHYKCLQNFFLSKISLPAAEVPLGLLPNLLDVSVLDQCGLRE